MMKYRTVARDVHMIKHRGGMGNYTYLVSIHTSPSLYFWVIEKMTDLHCYFSVIIIAFHAQNRFAEDEE